jgi:transposase-like protein
VAVAEITFIECPYGDSFPVRKTSDRSCGIQKIVCPDCGNSFEIMLPESVERLSRVTTSAADSRPFFQGVKPVFFEI